MDSEHSLRRFGKLVIADRKEHSRKREVYEFGELGGKVVGVRFLIIHQTFVQNAARPFGGMGVPGTFFSVDVHMVKDGKLWGASHADHWFDSEEDVRLFIMERRLEHCQRFVKKGGFPREGWAKEVQS